MMKLLQLYLLHAEEHTVVLINKIKEQSLYIYIQKPTVIIKGKL